MNIRCLVFQLGLCSLWKYAHGAAPVEYPAIDDEDHVGGSQLSMQQLESVLLSDLGEDRFGSRRLSIVNSSSTWDESIQKQWVLADETERAAEGGMSGNVPFLACVTDYALSPDDAMGVVTIELNSENINSYIQPLYNKVDMVCFMVQTRASVARNVTEKVSVVPFTPEMKLAPGILDAIQALEPVPSRIEATLCTDRSPKELKKTGSSIKKLVQNSHKRHLRSSEPRSTCLEIFEALEVQVGGNMVMLTIPEEDQGDSRAECLQIATALVATLPEVCFIGVYSKIDQTNSVAAGIVQSGDKDSTPFFVSGLDGKGQIVAVSDTGVDVDNCYMWDSERSVKRDKSGSKDIKARKVVQYFAFADSTDVPRGHGTHVAGTIAGRKAPNGVDEDDGVGDGIARAAKLAVFDFGDGNGNLKAVPITDLLEPGYSAGARIHSASWGSPGRSDYTSSAAMVDQFMWDNPDFLFISAAGNSGAGDKVGSVLSPSTNKNGISVGASQNDAPHINSRMSGPDYLVDFSSRGPTEDGRRKPDLVAPGSFLKSAKARPDKVGECDDSDGLTFSSGTSMSAPVVAGTAALLQQYFAEGWHQNGRKNVTAGIHPRASLIKATLFNGGQTLVGVQVRKTGETSPSTEYDIRQGYGRVSLIDSVPLTGHNYVNGIFVNGKTMKDGEHHEIKVVPHQKNGCKAPLQATLAWTDPAGAVFCNKGCVLNDLDLYVTRAGVGGRFYPNGLDQEDSINNAERVRISNAVLGFEYTIHIVGSRLIRDQEYSLALTGCFEEAAEEIVATTAPTASPIDVSNDDGISNDAPCVDSNEQFPTTNSQMQDCQWLAQNKAQHGHLCRFWDVARLCQATCNSCHQEPSQALVTSSVTAPSTGNRRWYGVQFDVRAKTDVVLESVDVQISNQGTFTVEVYIRPGRTTVSREPWTLLCRKRVKGQRKGTLVPLNCGAAHNMQANDLENLYVTVVEEPRLVIAQNDSSTTDILASSEHLDIYKGIAATYNNQGFYPNYSFTGRLIYQTHVCQDDGEVLVDDVVGKKPCQWLAQNRDRYGYLCLFQEAAAACSETCQTCD